jgi:hypothetical protein
MSLWRRQQRRRGRPAVLTGIALAVLTFGVGAVIVALTAAAPLGGSDGQAGSQADDGAGRARTDTLDSGPALGAPAEGSVQLPPGADHVNGYPVGFPHTDVGAVAALVEFNRAQIGFDYDQAAAVARVYAAPDDVDSVEARARESVANRRQQLGVDATGDAPAPAAFALTPFAFTLEELDDDSCAVTVLNLATTTTTKGEVRNLYYSGTQLVRWISVGEEENGDWKVVEPSAQEALRITSLPELPAVGPEDPQFEQSGWIALKHPHEPRTQAGEQTETRQ